MSQKKKMIEEFTRWLPCSMDQHFLPTGVNSLIQVSCAIWPLRNQRLQVSKQQWYHLSIVHRHRSSQQVVVNWQSSLLGLVSYCTWRRSQQASCPFLTHGNKDSPVKESFEQCMRQATVGLYLWEIRRSENYSRGPGQSHKLKVIMALPLWEGDIALWEPASNNDIGMGLQKCFQCYVWVIFLKNKHSIQ